MLLTTGACLLGTFTLVEIPPPTLVLLAVIQEFALPPPPPPLLLSKFPGEGLDRKGLAG